MKQYKLRYYKIVFSYLIFIASKFIERHVTSTMSNNTL